jgi:predicted ATPase
MYGGVGVGKTMLMDLFAHSAPPELRVMRTHFHDFMLSIHASLKKFAGTQVRMLTVDIWYCALHAQRGGSLACVLCILYL